MTQLKERLSNLEGRIMSVELSSSDGRRSKFTCHVYLGKGEADLDTLGEKGLSVGLKHAHRFSFEEVIIKT